MLATSSAVIVEAVLFALTMTTTSAAFAAAAPSARPATSSVLKRVFMASSSEHDVDGDAEHVHGALEGGLRVGEQADTARIHMVVLELHGHRSRRIPAQSDRRRVLLLAGNQRVHAESERKQRTHLRDHVAGLRAIDL